MGKVVLLRVAHPVLAWHQLRRSYTTARQWPPVRSPARALEKLHQTNPEALAIEADMTDVSAQRAMLDAVADRVRPLDILVSNARVLVERDFVREKPISGWAW
jgi:NAD(P)-dependent dehydrogenase (short-subunit alcohol dehydrogenase family)